MQTRERDAGEGIKGPSFNKSVGGGGLTERLRAFPHEERKTGRKKSCVARAQQTGKNRPGDRIETRTTQKQECGHQERARRDSCRGHVEMSAGASRLNPVAVESNQPFIQDGCSRRSRWCFCWSLCRFRSSVLHSGCWRRVEPSFRS